jgi:hypothetical protein
MIFCYYIVEYFTNDFQQLWVGWDRWTQLTDLIILSQKTLYEEEYEDEDQDQVVEADDYEEAEAQYPTSTLGRRMNIIGSQIPTH